MKASSESALNHQLDRRGLLRRATAAGLGLALPGFLTRAAGALPERGPWGRKKVLVTIFQRGAMDGLAAVAPLGVGLDRRRPQLVPPRRGEGAALALGQDFGLHPALGALHDLYRDGALAIVHAVGSPDATRSHFDAQDYMETGTPGVKGTPSGWLDRVGGRLGHDASPFRSVSLTASRPRSLAGEEPTLVTADLRSLRIRGGTPDRASSFEALWGQTTQELLRSAGADSFEAVEELARRGLASHRPSAAYPSTPLGRSLAQVAFLVKAEIGLEIAFAESAGWDTHVRQGGEAGSFAQRARDLAGSIRAFWDDLGRYRDDVAILTMTEFGRTVRENGSGGTDHGHGSCLFLLGGGVEGGKVHGDWPTLADSALYEARDLAVTTDFRAVFSSVAEGHLGVPGAAGLFPGWRDEPMALFT